MSARCSGCYDSFSGPWCDNCDQWPCVCMASSDPSQTSADAASQPAAPLSDDPAPADGAS